MQICNEGEDTAFFFSHWTHSLELWKACPHGTLNHPCPYGTLLTLWSLLFFQYPFCDGGLRECAMNDKTLENELSLTKGTHLPWDYVFWYCYQPRHCAAVVLSDLTAVTAVNEDNQARPPEQQKRCEEWLQTVREGHCCLGGPNQKVRNNWWENPAGETRSQTLRGFRCPPALMCSSALLSWVLASTQLSKFQSGFATFSSSP